MRPYTCTSGISNNRENIAFAEFLNTKDWSFYCTLSTRYSLTLKSARRAAERFNSHLQKHIGNVTLFWVAEPFDTKYSYHIHAFIQLGNPILTGAIEMLKKAWEIVTKGKGGKEYNHTHIKPYNKELGANYYISKYMMRYNADYDIHF